MQAERSLCKCTLDSTAVDIASRLVKYFIKDLIWLAAVIKVDQVVSHLSVFFSSGGIIGISKLKPGIDLQC